MSGVNVLTLLGRIAKEPELIDTVQSGSKLCKFTVVTNERFTDKAGQQQETTEYHHLLAWGSQAEVIANNKHTGDEIYLNAKKKTNKWETPEGEKRSRIEFHVTNFEFIGSKRKKDSDK
jgi:single-strand DNA-binding protein